MADNLAEEVDECPLNWGRLHTYWDRENCPLYGVAGVHYSGIEVNGRTVGTFNIISWVSAVEGCLKQGSTVGECSALWGTWCISTLYTQTFLTCIHLT